MSKETMKLALEALEKADRHCPVNTEAEVFVRLSITALREALAQPDFWEGYVPEPVGALGSSIKSESPLGCNGPAQQALNKKAENARELGLDYEPVCNKDPQGCWNVRCQLGKKCKNAPAQQEPLTDEQIDRLWSQSLADTKGETYLPLREFARAIEAAHGIKENT